MNYEITPRNRAREFFHQIHDKLEDTFFRIIQKLPEMFIPAALMHWAEVLPQISVFFIEYPKLCDKI